MVTDGRYPGHQLFEDAMMKSIHTVYVQNKDGSPLMPTRPAKAKWLIKNGKAKVMEKEPFTIRLTYQIEEPVLQPTSLVIRRRRNGGRRRLTTQQISPARSILRGNAPAWARYCRFSGGKKTTQESAPKARLEKET